MQKIGRRNFLTASAILTGSAMLPSSLFSKDRDPHPPNIILCMSDDQGWGDVGYNGHPVLRTPNLDQMAKDGIRFDRFYSGAPVCSPTRGSCVTGRHPFRYGLTYACTGHMRKEEITLAEALKPQGYRTGHFGKWHLGTLSLTEDQNRWGPWEKDPKGSYSPPWENGFDVCFSTESKVPTWNPMIYPYGSKAGERYGNDYWIGEDEVATENLAGDDSRVIMDRVIPFISQAADTNTPFLAVVWFHTPHKPVVAGNEYRELYKDCNEDEQHYFGCLTAMDEQVGRLRQELEELGVADNTMLWFCSDNGPEGPAKLRGRTQGSTGPFRGRKRSLYEGGVRVPGLLVWPERIKSSRTVDIPCSTSDYFPTVLDVLGYRLPEAKTRPYDGVSLLPLIKGNMDKRPRPIAFESKNQVSLTDNRYKIYSQNKGKSYELYDLIEDQGEETDIADKHPDIVESMGQKLEKWRQSCRKSANGKDY